MISNMATKGYPTEVEAKQNNKHEIIGNNIMDFQYLTDKSRDLRVKSNTRIVQNDFSKMNEDKATQRVKKTQAMYEEVEQPTANNGAVEGLAKNMIKTWMEMTANKRRWEQKHKGDPDAFYPHDEKLLNTRGELFHNC